MNMAVDQLSSVFMALADPTRRAIKVLERAGLISRNRAATARPSHLEAAPMKEAVMWMEKYRQYWESSFDRLDAALTEYQKGAEA